MNRPAQTRLDQADGDRYWQVILWQELAEDLYFDHVTFPAENFEQVRFRNCTLDHCRMGGLAAEHSDWHGVVFRDCDLSNLNLGDAVLSQVRFEDCKLVGANLSACGLHGVEFVRCNLSYSNFSLCQGRDLSFVECGLQGANLSQWRMGPWQVQACDLRGCNVFHNSLKGIYLADSQVEGILCTLEDLKGARVSPVQACQLASLMGLVVVD